MILTHERLKKKKICRLKLEEVFIEKTLVIIKPDGVTRRCKTSINRKNSTAFRAKES